MCVCLITAESYWCHGNCLLRIIKSLANKILTTVKYKNYVLVAIGAFGGLLARGELRNAVEKKGRGGNERNTEKKKE